MGLIAVRLASPREDATDAATARAYACDVTAAPAALIMREGDEAKELEGMRVETANRASVSSAQACTVVYSAKQNERTEPRIKQSALRRMRVSL